MRYEIVFSEAERDSLLYIINALRGGDDLDQSEVDMELSGDLGEAFEKIENARSQWISK